MTQHSTHRVAVIGDTFIDIIAGPMEKIPESGCSVRIPNPVTLNPGGSAFNTAVWLRALGVDTSLHTALGNDEHARRLRARAEEAKVDVHAAVLPDQGTAVCIVLSERSNRSFVSHYGVLDSFSVEHINEDALASATHIHVGGYFSCASLRTHALVELLRRARARGVTVSLDCNYDDTQRWNRDGMLAELLADVDVFFPNNDEAIAIAETSGDEDAALAWLSERVALVVMTLGGRGVKWRVKGGETQHVPALAVEEVDGVGAGDAFNAGFLRAWISDRSNIRKAVQAGSAAGALCVTQVGACIDSARFDELFARFASAS